MAIGIYTAASPGTKISQSADFTNPLLVSLDGKIGGVFQKQLFVRNDNSTLWYSLTTLTAVNNITPALINSPGYSWKLSAGGTQPTDEQWAAITGGNTISLPNLGTASLANTSTYLPFWLRVEIPRNVPVQTILDTTLNITTDENLI